ncbi:MAG: sodium/solute symporter [Lentisphaerae bacterium]|nr:sodium/solute symporter [Lentisphaerota bacterium]
MNAVDAAIFLAYLAGIVLLGCRLGKHCRDGAAFHLAGRGMRWLPIGVSVMATVFSAVNVAAFSGDVFAHGLYVTLVFPAFLLVIPVVVWGVIPFYHNRRAVSAYAFLEARFDCRVRRTAAALFILWRIAWMALVLYATSRLLAAGTRLDFRILIVLTAAAAALYAARGGMRSVMWTDVAQVVLLFTALAAALWVTVHAAGGPAVLWQRACAAGLCAPYRPFDASVLFPDPRTRISAWSALIGGSVAFLARYGADQMVVQRYFTARSLRDARRGFVLSILCSLAALSLLVLLGFAVYVHFARTGAPAASLARPVDCIARFAADLPTGLRGLLAAGLLAVTMASLDSGMHSCTTAVVTDFAAWLPPRAPASLRTERVVAAAVAVLTVAAAWHAGRLGSVFDVANRFINGLGAPLLAVVLCGRLPLRLTAAGVTAGAWAGVAASLALTIGLDALALHYYAVVNLLATLLLCWGFSRLTPLPAGNR